MTGPALTARATVDAIRRGEADAHEVTRSAVDRARQLAGLNAFISIADEEMIETSTRPGFTELSLAGLPVAVKDSIDVAGFPCTGGTPALGTPALRD